MLSPSMPFILYTSCCYIHLNQITQLILPECSSFSFPHIILSSMHLSLVFIIWQFHLCTSQSSPVVPFCLTHTATTVAISLCTIHYFTKNCTFHYRNFEVWASDRWLPIFSLTCCHQLSRYPQSISCTDQF